MKTGKVLSLIGAIGFGALLVYGLITNTFFTEGSILSGLLWGQISLIDVYIMFIILSFWVIYREKSAWKSTIWVILMMILGSFFQKVKSILPEEVRKIIKEKVPMNIVCLM